VNREDGGVRMRQGAQVIIFDDYADGSGGVEHGVAGLEVRVPRTERWCTIEVRTLRVGRCTIRARAFIGSGMDAPRIWVGNVRAGTPRYAPAEHATAAWMAAHRVRRDRVAVAALRLQLEVRA